MTKQEFDHLFGWMQSSPTWSREWKAIQEMRAENDWFREAKDTRDAEDENTVRSLKAEVDRLQESRNKVVRDSAAEINRLRSRLEGVRSLLTWIAESPSMSTTRGAVIISDELQKINAVLKEEA